MQFTAAPQGKAGFLVLKQSLSSRDFFMGNRGAGVSAPLFVAQLLVDGAVLAHLVERHRCKRGTKEMTCSQIRQDWPSLLWCRWADRFLSAAACATRMHPSLTGPDSREQRGIKTLGAHNQGSPKAPLPQNDGSWCTRDEAMPVIQ